MHKLLDRRTLLAIGSSLGLTTVLGAAQANTRTHSASETLDELVGVAQRYQIAQSTGSCGGREHGFLPTQLKKMFGMRNCKAIIIHGFRESEVGWKVVKLWDEMLVPFVSAKNNVESLSRENLAAIIMGTVTHWEEIGAVGGKIQVYWHSGYLQSRSSVALLKTFGAKPTDIVDSKSGSILNAFVHSKSTMHATDSYQTLAIRGSQDPAALVIGLRGVSPLGLRAVNLDGIFPFSEEAKDKYPVTIPIYLAHRPDEESKLVAVETMLEIISRVKIDRSIFWSTS